MMSWTRLLIIVIGLPAQALAASIQFVDISDAEVQSLKNRLPELFSTSPRLDRLDDTIRELMRQGRYENVIVERNSPSEYRIIGKTLRRVDEIQFIGNRALKTSAMRELFSFSEGDRFDRKRAVEMGQRLKVLYGESGYFNAVVEIEFKKTDSGDITVIYSIEEKDPCRIARIDFVTSNLDLEERLKKFFQKFNQKILTSDRAQSISKDLREFLIDQRYLAADVNGPTAKYNPDKTRAYLDFEIETPTRYEFFFEGNQRLTVTDLYSAMDLKNRERRNADPPTEAAERIRQRYLARGFPNIKIDTKVMSVEGSHLNRVFFNIDEGPRVRIEKMTIEGRISRNSKYYRDFILENSSKLVLGGYYNRSDLDNGFKNLVTELRNQGFLRANVLSSRIEYNEKKDMVVVYVNLDEGPQTQVRGLDFEGNHFFSSFELSKAIDLQANTPLRLDQFEESIEKLKDYYKRSGFLEMRILNEGADLIEYNETGTQARIHFKIFEGPRIRIQSIVVEGNTFTKSGVILKEADFKIGEILTPTKLEEATTRLNKLGLFSRADVRTLEEGTNVAERTLIVSVSERDPGLFRFGAGVNNERNFTARGFMGLGYNNLWGTGRAVSGRVEVKSNVAQVNFPETEITTGYLEPFLLNTRTRGRVNLTRSERVFDYESVGNITQITTSNRVDFLAERELTQVTKLTWKTWSLESRREWERHGRCIIEGNSADETVCSNTQQIATIGPTLDIDYRDNPFLPTVGSFTRFVVDYSSQPLGSSSGIEFARAEGNYTYYKRLGGSPRWIWANSLRGGYVANLSDKPKSGVPTSYAFLLGGIYTIRGFDLSNDKERVPRDGDGRSDSHPRGFEVKRGNQKLIPTDSNYYLYKSELRFPIIGDWGGVVFYDRGDVHVTGYKFARSMRDSYGFGIRYNTPVGPLAADIGFKIKPEKDEEDWRFHLSIGTF